MERFGWGRVNVFIGFGLLDGVNRRFWTEGITERV